MHKVTTLPHRNRKKTARHRAKLKKKHERDLRRKQGRAQDLPLALQKGTDLGLKKLEAQLPSPRLRVSF